MLRNKIVNIILSFIFIISLFRYYNAKNTDLSNENLSVTLLMVLCAFCVFGFRKEKYDILKGNYLKPSLIFFVGFVLVHFFEYLPYGASSSLFCVTAYSFLLKISFSCLADFFS